MAFEQELASSPAAALATLAWAAGLVGLSLAAFLPARRALERLAAPREAFEPRWGLAHALVVFGTYLVFLFGASLVAALLGVTKLDGLSAVLLTLGVQGAAVLMVAAFARLLHGDAAASLGLRAAGSGRAALFGAATYVLLVPALIGVILGWSTLLAALGIDAQEQDIVDMARELRGLPLALFVLLATVVVPLCEELLFRAFLQPLLVRRIGALPGVALAALLFAAAHHNLHASVPIFALALVLGWTMLRTQRLAACWTVHALHNGAMLALVLLAPDTSRALGP